VENQFNQVIMNVYAYDALWGDREHVAPEHNFAEPRVFPFGGSNKEPDFSTLNLEFFQRFDRVMKHLDQEGIISHLMIYVWNKKVNWPAAGSPDDNRYFDYVIKRYQAFPNLIWDISKEALGYGHNDMGYITERIERLRTLDGHKRLLSVHDYAYCKAFPGKVDFISIQNWDPNIYSVTREVVRRHPGKPVFNIEHGGYEKTMHSIFDGSYHDALACLDRNYQILFAGAYSTYYWQNSSWYEIVYDPAALPAEKQPKFSWYKHLVQLFRDYDYTRLRHHPGASNCLSDGKGNYLMYLPRGMISMQGDLKELKGKKARIRWFDPLRGIYVEGGSRDFSQGTWLGIPRSPVISSPICVGILEVED